MTETHSFEPSMSLTTVARLLVAAIVVILALVLWGVVSVVRRVRRRQTAYR